MTIDALCIGEALVEIMRTETDQPLDQPALFIGPYPSGAPLIFATQFARLNHRAALIASIGSDPFAKTLLRQLHADNIDARAVRQHPSQATGIAFVAYQQDGSRDFAFSPAAAMQLSADDLDPALFAGLRCLHICGSTLSLSPQIRAVCQSALALAQEQGALISFDPNLRPALLGIDQAQRAFAPFIAAADILLPTDDELRLLTGTASLDAAAATLLSSSAPPSRKIAVTRAAAGCSVFTAAERIDCPAYPITEIDPTGAGDCFAAAFIAAVLQGVPLQQAARLANAAGALAVSAKGPTSGIATAAQITQFMQQHAL